MTHRVVFFLLFLFSWATEGFYYLSGLGENIVDKRACETEIGNCLEVNY